MPKPKQLDLIDHLRRTDPKSGRNARYEERMREAGFVPVKVWVPEACRAPLQQMAELLRESPFLEPGPLRDPASGKLVSVRGGKRRD